MDKGERLLSRRQRVETWILLGLNRCFPRPRFLLQPEEAAGKSPQALEEEEFRTSGEGFLSLRKFLPLADITIVDLACGRGIKTTSYAAAALEVRRIVGIDVDQQALSQAEGLSRARGAKTVIFLRADAGCLPLKDQSVGLVMSENALEHVPDPQATLLEAGRVLPDGGILCLRFFPLFYSPYGSHLWDFLRIPWAHIPATSPAMVAAYRRIVAVEAPRLLPMFAGRYSAEDVSKYVEERVRQFASLNRMTPCAFYRSVAASGGWRILEFRFIHTSLAGRLVAYCPGLDRFAVGGIYCVLRRDRESVLRPGAFISRRFHGDLRGGARRFVAWAKAAVGRA